MMLALASRNGIANPYPSISKARAAYDFGSLQSFLDLYYRGM
jgi:adenosine deaminase